MVANAIETTNLTRRFGERTAVEDLTLAIPAGTVFGFLGPNGAGKTTTVEMFEGLLKPDGGTLEVLGERWTGDGQKLRRRLGIQLQETRFPEKLKVAELATLFRSFYRSGLAPREALALVGLEEKAKSFVRELSGGQKQRLSLACALVGDPEILFLDEPTTGLDPMGVRQLRETILRLNSDLQMTVFMNTHLLSEVAKVCTTIGVLSHGELIYNDSIRATVARFPNEASLEDIYARVDAKAGAGDRR